MAEDKPAAPQGAQRAKVGLARGGKQFQFVVTAFLQQAGRVFANEKMYKQVAFQQLAFADERKVGFIRSILDKLFN